MPQRPSRPSPAITSCYAQSVQPVNFADPSFEPTDEQLAELAREAFGTVRADAERALARFEDQIAELRRQAIERVAGTSPDNP